MSIPKVKGVMLVQNLGWVQQWATPVHRENTFCYGSTVFPNIITTAKLSILNLQMTSIQNYHLS